MIPIATAADLTVEERPRSCGRFGRRRRSSRGRRLLNPIKDLLQGVCLPDTIVLDGNEAQVQFLSDLAEGQSVPPELTNKADNPLFLVIPHQSILDNDKAKRYLSLAVPIAVSVVVVEPRRS